MNRLHPDVFFLILQRLPIENKFLLKAVCKKWHTFIISRILPTQDKLSFEKDYFVISRCIDPDHQLDVQGKYSIPFLPVIAKRDRKRFFKKEVTGLKVLKFCEGQDADRVMKYYLPKRSASRLECLHIFCCHKPLVKVLPKLQHFSADRIDLVPFVSVLQYCPILTHLSIDTRNSRDDFVDTLINLPKGLQYLMLGGKSCELLAVICSPAMETLESVVLRHWNTPRYFSIPHAKVKPAPRLQRFSMSSYMDREEDRRMIVDFTKECPVLKKIDLRVLGLTLEDYLNIYSQLSNLEMINLALKFEFDDVIRMILWENRRSLKYLEIGNPLLNLESIKKLAEFKNLQTLSFCSTLPSYEQLLVFAQRRLHVSQSRLQLKSNAWNENHVLDPLGPALQDANIELVAYGKYPDVMD